MGAPANADVTVDDQPVRAGGEQAIAPGVHHVRVSAPRMAAWVGDVDVAPGARRTLTVRLVETGRWSVLPLAVSGGAAVVLGVGGIVLGAMTASTHARFEGLSRARRAATT